MWPAKLRVASVRYICPVAYSVRWSGQICRHNVGRQGAQIVRGSPEPGARSGMSLTCA
jgi:hypothetical protein